MSTRRQPTSTPPDRGTRILIPSLENPARSPRAQWQGQGEKDQHLPRAALKHTRHLQEYRAEEAHSYSSQGRFAGVGVNQAPSPFVARGYRPISATGWLALMEYLAQLRAKLHDPGAPEPDLQLLTVDPNGPFRSLRMGKNPETGQTGIFLQVRNVDRGPRWAPGPVILLLRLLLAMGGSLSINDNGSGWATIRIYNGWAKQTVERVITDARFGEIVRHRGPMGETTDHHLCDPRFRTKEMAKLDWRGGKPTRTPSKGRAEAITTSLLIFQRNQHRSELSMSQGEYRAVLEEAFGLFDLMPARQG